MSVFYAVAQRAPSPPADLFEQAGMELHWESNGLIWDLCKGESGVYLLAGIRGLHLPTGVRYRDTSPSSHGSQHRGHVWSEREVFWPIKTWHADKGQAWADRDAEFFAGIDPDIVGRWTVTQPGGEKRYLDLRYEPTTADPGFDTIPSLMGWARYGVYMTADQPFWVGSPSVRSWKGADDVPPFFEPTGPGLLNLVQGFTFENAQIDNLGDVPSFIRWFIDGPALAGTSVGVGGKLVTVPFEVPDGKCLVIESDPVAIGATMYDVINSGGKPSERVIGVDMMNPVDASGDLGEADFGSVPPGRSVPLQIQLQGGGLVEAYVPNLYKRAWGRVQNNAA